MTRLCLLCESLIGVSCERSNFFFFFFFFSIILLEVLNPFKIIFAKWLKKINKLKLLLNNEFLLQIPHIPKKIPEMPWFGKKFPDCPLFLLGLVTSSDEGVLKVILRHVLVIWFDEGVHKVFLPHGLVTWSDELLKENFFFLFLFYILY